MQADVLDRRPDNGQTTGFGREGVDLIGALSPTIAPLIRKDKQNKQYLYVCTFWSPSLKLREVHTKHQAQRRNGIVHEAKRADVVDGDVGFHGEPPRW